MDDDFIPGDDPDELLPGDRSDERRRPVGASGDGVPHDDGDFLLGEDDTGSAEEEEFLLGEEPQAAPAPAGTGDAPPPLPSGRDPVARRGRIREVTRRGGFAGVTLPLSFDEDEDWRCAEAADPFERLFLDARQHPAISDETVQRHGMLLKEFWGQRARVVESGSPQQIRDVVNRYGGGSRARLMAYPGDVERAVEQLSTAEQRRQAAAQVAAQRRDELLAQIRRALRDGMLTAGEADDLIELDGAALGVEPDEAAALIREELDAQGFRPAVAPGQPVPEDPFSVQWLSEDEYRGWRTKQEQRADLPLLIGSGRASTLADLVALCDRERDEAAQALFDGHIEPWLARLGQTPLAREAKIAREGSDHGARRFERFVRAVAQAAGLPATPTLRTDAERLALGTLPKGAGAAAPLALRREGPRRAWGTVEKEGTLPGLVVPDGFAIDDAGIDVRLNSLHVPPGRYEGALVVRPEGGTSVRVPVAYTVAPITAEPTPATLALGGLPFNVLKEVKLAVRVRPDGGRLAGSARLTPEHPGLQLKGEVGGALSMLTLAIATGAFEAGERYQGKIELDTNAGPVAVPVSFNVRVAWGRVALWAAAFAASLGALFGFIRNLAAESSVALQGFAPDGAEDGWGAYLLLLLALAVVGFVVRKLYREPKRRTKKAQVATDG